jgi:hypothetical protein
MRVINVVFKFHDTFFCIDELQTTYYIGKGVTQIIRDIYRQR